MRGCSWFFHFISPSYTHLLTQTEAARTAKGSLRWRWLRDPDPLCHQVRPPTRLLAVAADNTPHLLPSPERCPRPHRAASARPGGPAILSPAPVLSSDWLMKEGTNGLETSNSVSQSVLPSCSVGLDGARLQWRSHACLALFPSPARLPSLCFS